MPELDMWRAAVLAVGGAVVANLAIYVGARRLFDIDPAFQPLSSPGSTVFLTSIGVGGAAYVYHRVRRRAGAKPAFLRFALLALLLSFIPDVFLLATDQPGADFTSVTVLMSMHVVAAVIAVGVLTRVPASSAQPL